MSSFNSAASIFTMPALDARDLITQRNQRNSSLLRLSAELRNEIYVHAFGPREILVDKIEHSDEVSFWDSTAQALSIQESLRLMRTCRQIRSETRLWYWQTRTFRVGPPSEADSAMRNWVDERSEEQRRAISDIIVHKDEVLQEALWEQLPKLTGLKRLTFWGSYFNWDVHLMLGEDLTKTQLRVGSLVGHYVQVDVEKEQCWK